MIDNKQKFTYFYYEVRSEVAEEIQELIILSVLLPFPQVLLHKSQEALIQVWWIHLVLITGVVTTGGFRNDADFFLLLHLVLHFLELCTC